MIEGVARLKYYTNWAIAYVDPQLGEYYFSLCPKYWYLQRPKTPAHITIVRKDIEVPSFDRYHLTIDNFKHSVAVKAQEELDE